MQSAGGFFLGVNSPSSVPPLGWRCVGVMFGFCDQPPAGGSAAIHQEFPQEFPGFQKFPRGAVQGELRRKC